jgi:anti-sigma regulatory factor (Ser/Thr protein kinase)
MPARLRLPRVAEHVDIEIPLHTRHASTVRAVAAAVCADLGFSVDAIDDLRLGVNEAVSLLSDVDAAPGARLRITFEADDSVVTVRCTRRGVDAELHEDDIDVLARRILDHVVDEYSVSGGTFTVVKRVATPT